MYQLITEPDKILTSLADGTFNQEHWNKLKERDFNGGNFSPQEQKAIYAKSTLVCARNKDKTKFNIDQVKALEMPIAGIKSMNSNVLASVASPNKAGNLDKDIILAKGCQVLLTQNLWPKVGLTNGARGIVKHIIYEKGVKPPKLPILVIVQFDQYSGPIYKDMEKCVPITPATTHWFEGTTAVTRTMLPLFLAYAISIHKSQGMTLDNVMVNIGPNEFSNGLTNTAITRVRKFENLTFNPFYSYERFKKIFAQKAFKDRMKHDEKERESDEKFVEKAKNVQWLVEPETDYHNIIDHCEDIAKNAEKERESDMKFPGKNKRVKWTIDP